VGNTKLGAEGSIEHGAGNIRKKVGELEKVIETS
jgi:hypothetical protein